MKENEDNLRILWDIIKHTSTCIAGDPEEQVREKWGKVHIKLIMTPKSQM